MFKKNKSQGQPASDMYKGYSISWLRKLGEEHPDFYLVAEYDALNEPVVEEEVVEE